MSVDTICDMWVLCLQKGRQYMRSVKSWKELYAITVIVDTGCGFWDIFCYHAKRNNVVNEVCFLEKGKLEATESV